MPKKKDLEDLLNNVPSPNTTHNKIIISLFMLLMFSVVFYLGSVTYTGLAVSDLSQSPQGIINNQNILMSNRFEILDVEKTSNSVLNIKFSSSLLLNIFVETEDCSFWKNGQDKDNTVLYSINNVKEGNFNIGDPSENTIQQVELYTSDKLCLIFINKEFPSSGSIDLQYQEQDVNQWRIV